MEFERRCTGIAVCGQLALEEVSDLSQDILRCKGSIDGMILVQKNLPQLESVCHKSHMDRHGIVREPQISHKVAVFENTVSGRILRGDGRGRHVGGGS